MDYEAGFDLEEYNVDAIIGDYDVDFDDDALTLPEDDQFED